MHKHIYIQLILWLLSSCYFILYAHADRRECRDKMPFDDKNNDEKNMNLVDLSCFFCSASLSSISLLLGWPKYEKSTCAAEHMQHAAGMEKKSGIQNTWIQKKCINEIRESDSIKTDRKKNKNNKNTHTRTYKSVSKIIFHFIQNHLLNFSLPKNCVLCAVCIYDRAIGVT